MAARKDITVDQGGQYVLAVQVSGLVPNALSGYSARMFVRAHKEDTTSVAPAQYANLPADLSAYLVVDSGAATVTLTVPDAVSAAFTWARGVYDIEVYKTSSPTYRVVQGSIVIDREVTR